MYMSLSSMSFPPFSGFFSSVFGRDCSEIETDPKADPFDKEICHSFRQFEESFGGFFHEHQSEEDSDNLAPPTNDPESLRESILSRPQQPNMESKQYRGPRRRPHSRLQEDENLDDEVEKDPTVLDRFLPRDPVKSRDRRHQFSTFSSHSSVSIRTIRKPDGSIEEHKTVKDSTGNSKTTVAHILPGGRILEEQEETKEESIEQFLKPKSSVEKLYDWLWWK